MEVNRHPNRRTAGFGLARALPFDCRAGALPRLCVREDQFPIPIQGPNESRPRWLASASAPDLPIADLVAGRVPRKEKAPATWSGP
jgi:hypothetical protein